MSVATPTDGKLPRTAKLVDFCLNRLDLFLLGINSAIYLLYFLLYPGIAFLLVGEAGTAALLGVQIVDSAFAIDDALVHGTFLLYSSQEPRIQVFQLLGCRSNLCA